MRCRDPAGPRGRARVPAIRSRHASATEGSSRGGAPRAEPRRGRGARLTMPGPGPEGEAWGALTTHGGSRLRLDRGRASPRRDPSLTAGRRPPAARPGPVRGSRTLHPLRPGHPRTRSQTPEARPLPETLLWHREPPSPESPPGPPHTSPHPCPQTAPPRPCPYPRGARLLPRVR